MCRTLHAKQTCTIRECVEVLGSLVAAEPGVDFAPLHYKRLEHEKIQALKARAGDYEGHMRVTEVMKQDLSWWILHVKDATKKIARGPPALMLLSDSSDFAWGGVHGECTTGGPWVGAERDLHINAKELQAAFFTLKAFCKHCSHLHVRLQVDNTAAVAYINAKVVGNISSMRLHVTCGSGL